MHRKKHLSVAVFILVLWGFSLTACEKPSDENSNIAAPTPTGRVTFFNNSSYIVNIRHGGGVSGHILLQLNSGASRTIDVRANTNHSSTTFGIEFLWLINRDINFGSEQVYAIGEDFYVQPNIVVQEGRLHTVQIPQPTNLVFRNAFMKIINAHNLPMELRNFAGSVPQAGNNNIPVSPGRVGVYQLGGIPVDGMSLEGHSVGTVGFAPGSGTPIPQIIVRNGVIYSFLFDGSSLIKTGEQSIEF